MQSIEELPALLVTVWGIDLVVAQVILSTSVILAIVLPIIILRWHGGNHNIGTEILGASLGMFICVGLSWLPLWVLLVSLSMTAIGIAFLSGKIFGGS